MISAEKSVYISYSWGAEKKHPIVDKLLSALKAKGIDVKRDTNSINYGDSIRTYMDELASGSAIILVLSEGYFKSLNCMYELMKIYNYDSKEFLKRIFPVVLKGTRFHKSIDRIPYIRFWEEETDNLNTAHDSVSKTNISTASHQELRDYASFAYMISDLQALIGDMNHLTEEEHLKTGFSALIERIFPDLPPAAEKNITTAKLGMLFNVPNLPPSYFDRSDDIEKIRSALLSGETQAVGITGKAQYVGVQGMGGLGKSVLAAAVAHDEEVRAAFSDGIFWLRFRQDVDDAYLLEQQAEILKILAPGQLPDSLVNGKNLFNLALENKHCLFIADDLWDSRHLCHFILKDTGCRFLLTTRNAEVIKKIGAFSCELRLLSEPQARKLLAECSGYAENDLPEEAAAILRECGHLPLAVAAIGSMVKGKPVDRWQMALKKLQNARLDKIPANLTLEYDYKNLFKVFQISVEDLPPEVQAYYKTLIVFPEDSQIPESILQLYWGRCRQGDYEPLDAVDLLEERSLLSRIDDKFVTQHDLLTDYLVFQADGDIAKLHKQLLDAYAAEYPEGWHTIPYDEDGYFYTNWTAHARAANDPTLAAEIADALIRHQPLLNMSKLDESLKFVDYDFAAIAPYLLKESKNDGVLKTSLELLGDNAKEDARRLLESSKDEWLLLHCIRILGEEAEDAALQLIETTQDNFIRDSCRKLIARWKKDNAIRLLKESADESVLSACLTTLGYEAKEDARRLLKESQQSDVLTACLNILGDEAKEDARRLLKESQEQTILITCLKILGKEAKEDAQRIVKDSNQPELIAICLKMLGNAAREDARRLLKESQEQTVLTTCLNILGDEAKDDAHRLIKTSKNQDVLAACLKILGNEAKEDARLIVKENQSPGVLVICLKLLGKEAEEDARRLLKESFHPHVFAACLDILSEEAKEEARQLIKSSKDESLLLACLRILGNEAEEHAKVLLKTSTSRIVREACKKILFS